MVDTTGFVTSLVINCAIALFALTTFFLVRHRYPWCFETRMDAKRRKIGVCPPPVPPGRFGWLRVVTRLTDTEQLETSGLDAVMFLKFFEICAALFCLLTVLGIGILLPVNVTASNDISDGFDKMSMSNVPVGSHRFWAHLIIAYLFCGAFYYLCLQAWEKYANLRQRYLQEWAQKGGGHTVLVRNLPRELRSDAALFSFFTSQFPGEVRSATLAKDLTLPEDQRLFVGNKIENLPDLCTARTETVSALEHDVATWEKQQADPKLSEAKKAKRPQAATKCFCCGKVDAIDHHCSVLEQQNSVIEREQKRFGKSYADESDAPSPSSSSMSAAVLPDGSSSSALATASSKGKTTPNGFVTFHTSRAAQAALGFAYDRAPFTFDLIAAPELRDVWWPSLQMPFRQRTIYNVVIPIAVGALILFWMIPLAFIVSISNIPALATKCVNDNNAGCAWLQNVVDVLPSVIMGFITAYLPAIVLIVFFILLPMILLAMSKLQGIEAQSWLQRSVTHKYFLFMVINFFFGSIVAGSIFSNIAGLLGDPGNIPTILGEQIPTVANYFVNYLALQAFAGFPLNLLQIGRLLVGNIKKKYFCVTPRDFEAVEAPPEINYGTEYCPHLFIFLIAITYCYIAPIIIPFSAVYFGLGWIVNRYQLTYVYVQSFESGGTFWPIVYSKMSSALFIGQLCFVGILGLKQVPAEAALVVPLPICTLLFDRYIHNAIKAKCNKLPLGVINEIDEERRLKTEKERGLAINTDSSQVPRKVSPAVPSEADAQAPTEQTTPTDGDEAHCSNAVIHTNPAVVPRERDNTQTKSTDAYIHNTDKTRSLGMSSTGVEESVLPFEHVGARLGFPYADSDQNRFYAEGDVPAYVQPELIGEIPARMVVDRADRYISDAASLSATKMSNPADEPANKV